MGVWGGPRDPDVAGGVQAIDGLPGGVLAVNLFGDRDAWAGEPGMTFLTREAARMLCAGLEISFWHEEDAEGPAYSGPKHWHVYDIVALSPAPDGVGLY
jgi:hypothetical protein